MSQVSSGTARRLRRSLGARMFGGWVLQWLPSVGVIVHVALILAFLAFDLPLNWAQLAPALPVYAVWLVGMTASARLDDTALSWRYFRRRRCLWPDIEAIRFGGDIRPGYGPGNLTTAAFVTVRGQERSIIPLKGCSTRSRTEFGTALIARAATYRIPVRVSNAGWEGLAPAEGVIRTPYQPPGRKLSANGARLRVGGVGLVLAAGGVCSLVSAFTGWDSRGMSPVAAAILGVVLLLIGVGMIALTPFVSGR